VVLYEGAEELNRLVASVVPREIVDLGPAVFGLLAPRGAEGVLHFGAQLADAVLSGLSGTSAEDSTASGIAIAGSSPGIWVVGASRPGRFLQSAAWVTRGTPFCIPWAHTAEHVQVEQPNAEQIFLTLPFDGEPRRYLFWNGIAGLPANLEAARQIVRALGIP
jgi:hypothetical protein